MSIDPIIIVGGEPNSVFLEIFFKTLKKTKINKPVILISSVDIVKLQMKKLNFHKKIKLLRTDDLISQKLNNHTINLIDIKYNVSKPFEKISSKSNKFINLSFETAFKIIKTYKLRSFINGPINKKTFLNNSFFGITELISSRFKIKKHAMLIYNKKLSVCPITTHEPINEVSKSITKKKIIDKIKLINEFYKKKLNIKAKIAVLGLNPHCESSSIFNEDEKIIKPAIKFLKKKKLDVSGPFSADTMFLSQNRTKYNVIIGMYHDQVLTPLKTLFEYDAINITLGLPFIRISPDHGPNEKMMGKNLSNPLSLIQAIKFLDKN